MKTKTSTSMYYTTKNDHRPWYQIKIRQFHGEHVIGQIPTPFASRPAASLVRSHHPQGHAIRTAYRRGHLLQLQFYIVDYGARGPAVELASLHEIGPKGVPEVKHGRTLPPWWCCPQGRQPAREKHKRGSTDKLEPDTYTKRDSPPPSPLSYRR